MSKTTLSYNEANSGYEHGSPELRDLYQNRKKDVIRAVGYIEPLLLNKMEVAEKKERGNVTIPLDTFITVLNALAFIQMLETYEKGRLSIPVDLRTGKPMVSSDMKAECIGEFSFETEQTCYHCYEIEKDKDCEVCGGEVNYQQKVTVPWNTCKDIYKAMAAEAGRA